jgi:cysteinyl-tRNA synthetase
MVRIRDTPLRDTVELTTRAGEARHVRLRADGHDAPHIGNACTAVVFDTIRGYLEWTGLDVTYVSNVTDVDDKIIARAAEQGRTEPDLARHYEDTYFAQMAQLNVREPDHRPHATEYIERMQP